ncbi:hypothetical protein V6N13_110358 [Hibiscus sabdariffa]
MAKKELVKEAAAEEGEVCRADFPPNFLFGVATASYQIEGACNEGGRGPSIWDSFSHTEGKIIDGSNGDVAVDHYHRYKEDVDLIHKFGFDAYRFSISWSRIFPDGLGTKVNDEGISFYNNLINALIEKGIRPFATLYHWDLPLHLQESIGGWLDKQIVNYFAIYADTCFAHFGDRVKNWITINEPLQTAVNGYDAGIFAPGRREGSSAEPYWVAHHQILAHATAVSIYRSKYKDNHGGQIGLVLDCEWAEANSDKIEDKTAAARRLDFQLGCHLREVIGFNQLRLSSAGLLESWVGASGRNNKFQLLQQLRSATFEAKSDRKATQKLRLSAAKSTAERSLSLVSV